MDPISAGLLVAMATGAGGEAGRSLWETLTGLVRRNPERQPLPAVRPTGEDELAALDESPYDRARARLLSEALTRRAQQDPAFRAALEQWNRQAQALRAGDGETANTINGGTQHGPVLQGRDFSGITFNSSAEEDPARRRDAD